MDGDPFPQSGFCAYKYEPIISPYEYEEEEIPPGTLMNDPHELCSFDRCGCRCHKKKDTPC